MAAVKRTVGRPTDYRPDYNDLAYQLCLVGYTDKGLAKAFGVSRSTLSRWYKHHPEFSDTVRRGKSIADAQVAAALYRCCTGYEYDTERIQVLNNQVARIQIKKHVPPDIASCKIWLKNRQPTLWRDKQDVNLTSDITVKLDLNNEGNSLKH